MSSHEFLRFAVIYLGSAVLAVLLFHRLGLGSVLGYLLAGIVIGPSALGLVSSPARVLQFSEFGVVLLLFLIGLELNPRRLWALRKPIFGMGGLQVAVCTLALSLVALAFGFEIRTSIILAGGFALSSTAIALQLLRERNLHQIPVGESSFAVLLFQDLAVIPMLALLPFLAPETGNSPAAVGAMSRLVPLGEGALALVVVVLLGRYLVRPVFRAIARTQLRELFTAFALSLIFGVSMLMEEVGLSMALGAFLAGVLLAESEFRHELEVDLEPFKGLLLGLFFIAVGMSTPIGLLADRPIRIVGLTLALLVVKLSGIYGVSRIFGQSRDESRLMSVALSQGGEFAFVLFGLAGQLGALPPETRDLFNICIALSMATTPFLFMALDYWKRKNEGTDRAAKAAGLGPEHAVQAGNPVILAGFGRVGQVAARVLTGQKIGITILEQDPGQIESMKQFGWVTYYGDVSRLDLLRAAGAETARLLILAIDDMDAIARTVELVRENFPELRILVRADSRIDAYHFINLDVPVVRSTFAPGLEMGEEALKMLGYSPYEAHVIGQRFKRYDRGELHRQAKHVGDLDTMIALSTQAREELLRIMAMDREKRGVIADDGWG